MKAGISVDVSGPSLLVILGELFTHVTLGEVFRRLCNFILARVARIRDDVETLSARRSSLSATHCEQIGNHNVVVLRFEHFRNMSDGYSLDRTCSRACSDTHAHVWTSQFRFLITWSSRLARGACQVLLSVGDAAGAANTMADLHGPRSAACSCYGAVKFCSTNDNKHHLTHINKEA